MEVLHVQTKGSFLRKVLKKLLLVYKKESSVWKILYFHKFIYTIAVKTVKKHWLIDLIKLMSCQYQVFAKCQRKLQK